MEDFLWQVLASIVAIILWERVFPQLPLLIAQIRQLKVQLRLSTAAIIGYLFYPAWLNFVVFYTESLTFQEAILIVPALSLMGVLMAQLNLLALEQ